jgi:hypothetical protein
VDVDEARFRSVATLRGYLKKKKKKQKKRRSSIIIFIHAVYTIASKRTVACGSALKMRE